MKTTKKLLAMAMVIMMILSLAISALAATTGTVQNDTDRTYKAYQIFSGTQAEDSAVLGDVVWGSGIDDETFLAALKENDLFEACVTAADVAAVLESFIDESEAAQAFANLAAKHLTDAATDIEANATVTLASGYYLLVDDSSGNASQNPALLQVTNDNDLHITDKSGVPSVNKTIEDEGDAAEGSVGDTFTFVLTATMPATFEGYDTYMVVFHDTLSAGLTYDNSLTVTVNGVDKTGAFAVSHDAGKLTVSCNDVLAQGAIAGCDIIVTYNAKLNADAVVGAGGNSNTVKLEYSNDPNWNGTPDEQPTKETPEDTVVIFTFELDVTKVDGETQVPLKDAMFKLQSQATGKWAVVNDEGKVTDWSDTEEGGSVLTSDDAGLFNVGGLDQGTYNLKEIEAPAGYNLLEEPVIVVITAEVTDNEQTQELTALAITADDTEGTGDAVTGIVAANVENNSGAVLPETGGTGTTLFYVFGAVLMIGAVVLLVTKKRMSAAE